MFTQNWLAAQAHSRPDGIALIAGERQWTYRQLYGHVRAHAARLAAAGIGSGWHVGVLMPSSAEHVFVIHALMALGAVLVPLNARLTTGELLWQIRHANCQALIYAPETAAKIAHIESAGFTALRVDPVEDASASYFEKTAPADSGKGIITNMNALQAVVFTSGTSGRPKGAMLTYANHFWSATASAYRIGALPHDRWLCPLPLYHVGGLSILLRCCLYGTAVVLQDGSDAGVLIDLLHRHRVTLVSLVPTMLYRLLDLPSAALPEGLRLILLGGAAASPELLEACARRGVPAALTYGLTEACSQVATMLPEDVRRKPGSVGKPLLFTSVSITDDTGTPLPCGEYGEVVVRGPTVMAGYYDDTAATEQTLRGGALHTGDIGYLDADGDLWLVQRRSDLIVSGGENVYPAEIEQVLSQHPAVAQVCVVGVPDAEWGQRVAAAVVVRTDFALTEHELLAFSRQHLAGFKQPRQIRFFDALPQTASGKLQRSAVAELFEV